MIGRVAGRLEYKASDHVLIDVKGVGYVVYVSDRVMAGLPAPGGALALYTDLLVREDLLQLFGFTTLVEKEWHRLLMSVQGIGAKASMAILGALGTDGVGRAIALGDWAAVATAKGVGPKTAKKAILELKDKAHSVMAMAGTGPSPTPADAGSEDVLEPVEVAAPTSDAAQSEALSALGNLGYGPSEATQAVAQAAGEDPEADTAGLIRAALKLLAPKG
ncbi:Holliday junction branch migration protein RuvA [Pseudooctadecabacter sp.]|uniref:Holliday junction branch migration protein RuvA n=1 Tax=Pseudooctadecabacter sp. TaxID=1966338 RepID=UPI0035C832D1